MQAAPAQGSFPTRAITLVIPFPGRRRRRPGEAAGPEAGAKRDRRQPPGRRHRLPCGVFGMPNISRKAKDEKTQTAPPPPLPSSSVAVASTRSSTDSPRKPSSLTVQCRNKSTFSKQTASRARDCAQRKHCPRNECSIHSPRAGLLLDEQNSEQFQAHRRTSHGHCGARHRPFLYGSNAFV